MKITRIIQTTAVLLFSIINVFGQTNSIEKDGFKISQMTKTVKDIKVLFTQKKPLTKSNFYCTASIKIFKSNKLIDSLIVSPDELEPVGSDYGLLIYNELINDHIIVSKFGGYDGRTIIINNKGKMFNTTGGICCPDYKHGLLFSIYNSDNHGFSIFDLSKDREIFSQIFEKDEVMGFFLSDGNYFVKTKQYKSQTERIWQIDIKTKKIVERPNTESQAISLRELVDYKKVCLKCE